MPYPAVTNDLTGEVEVWGQKFVYCNFDVQLEEQIVQVPLFAIQYEGEYFAKGSGQDAFETRAKSIVEMLALAWDLLDGGARLEVKPDDWGDWKCAGGSANKTTYPAIYLVSEIFDDPLRIMTIYPQDVYERRLKNVALGGSDGRLKNVAPLAVLAGFRAESSPVWF